MCRFVVFLLCLVSLAYGQSLDDLTRIQNGRSRRVSSSADDWRNSNVDFRPIRAGESLTLADLKGPGTIERIWLTILPSEPGYARLMTVRIYWDGEKDPSVEAPLGDFFGVGHGLDKTFESISVRATSFGKARSCFWPMPFRKSARIVVSNDGSEATWCFYYAVDWRQGPVGKDAPYFHASYRQAFPTPLGSDYRIADIEGRGHYVGTVLSVRSVAPGWWGEGDEFFYLDGEKAPSLKGTGLEDYFGEAWGLHPEAGLYSGVTALDGSRATAYRWHIPDPVRFDRSLKVEIEHKGQLGGKPGNNNEREDDFSSVAYWYQLEPHKPYPPLPGGYDRLPFDFRKMIQGESLVGAARHEGGELKAVKANGLSKDAELEWTTQPGNSLSLPFEVPADGSYEVLLVTTNRWDSGVYDVYLDEDKVLPNQDFHAEDNLTYQQTSLDFRRLRKGTHTLRFVALSRPGWFGLDGFVLARR